MNKFVRMPIGKIVDIYDCLHVTPEYSEDGYPMVRVSEVNNSFLSLDNALKVTDEIYELYTAKHTPIKGDIILARVGAYLGEFAYVETEDEFCIGQNTSLLSPKESNKYIYYNLISPRTQLRILREAAGSAYKSIGVEAITKFELDYHKDAFEREKIGNFLYTLDRKITLNNAINAELEKVAKLLYDYWFVQFDFPNANGKPYRASGSAMEYNEQLKREIPKGWEAVPFSDIITENKQTLSDDVDKADMLGLDLSIMPGNTMCLNQRGSADDFDSNRFRLSKYDLLFGSIRPYLRKAGFSAFDGVVNGTIMNFCCKDKQDYSFALCTLTGEGMFQYADMRSRGNGTRMPTINATELLGYTFAYDQQTANAFDKQVSKYWKMIADNINQNFELIALRDFLLPLLMNGQVTIAALKEKPFAVKELTKREAVFKRLVLSAYILDNICDEPTAGRVKFEKLLYLSEYCAQLPLHSEFQRAAAGPYDSKSLYSIESQLNQNKWFKRQKVTGESRAYTRLGKVEGYKSYVATNFDSKQKDTIDKLINLFKTARTIQCEIVATLYGAWNDFLIDGIQPTDSKIVDEVLTNWHEKKERIDRNRWLNAIEWMRKNDIIPVAYGVSTKRANDKERPINAPISRKQHRSRQP